jgi:hypothetical protein
VSKRDEIPLPKLPLSLDGRGEGEGENKNISNELFETERYLIARY